MPPGPGPCQLSAHCPGDSMEGDLETKPSVRRGLASARAAAPTRSGTTNTHSDPAGRLVTRVRLSSEGPSASALAEGRCCHPRWAGEACWRPESWWGAGQESGRALSKAKAELLSCLEQQRASDGKEERRWPRSSGQREAEPGLEPTVHKARFARIGGPVTTDTCRKHGAWEAGELAEGSAWDSALGACGPRWEK